MQKSNFSLTPAWKARIAADSSADHTADGWAGAVGVDCADDSAEYRPVTLDDYAALAFKELQSRLAELWDELLESLLPIVEDDAKRKTGKRFCATACEMSAYLILSLNAEAVRCRSPPLLWEIRIPYWLHAIKLI